MVRAFAISAMGGRTGTKSKTMMGSTLKVRAFAIMVLVVGRKVGVNTWLERSLINAMGGRTGTKSKTMMGSTLKVRAFAIMVLVVGRKVGGNTWLECSLSVRWSDGR